MSDPMNRPVTPPPAAPPPETERKSASPLVWLLLLIALLAVGWYFYSQRSATTDAELPPTAIGDGTTPDPAVTPAPRPVERTPRPEATPAQPDNAPARVLSQTEPEYPKDLRRVGKEGSVVVSVDVDATGKPSNIVLKQRSGERDFDRAALQAVEQWTFEAARENGKAVASTVDVPIDFRMQP